MGCGSVLGDLFYLADSLIQRESGNGWRVASNATFPAYRTPSNDLRDQLYQIYGEGQISEEIFTALRTLADRDQLRPADLAVHRARVGHCSLGQVDPVAANALRGIASRLTQLAQARSVSEKVLADLETQLLDIERRVADKEQAAREIVEHDEESARQRLTEKAELVLSRDRLTAQVQALRADLCHLDDLCAQLQAKSIELEAVQARSRLNEAMLQRTA